MISAIPIEEIRDHLADLPEQFDREPDLIVQVTREGEPVMAVLSWQMYESLMETLAIMGDPALTAAIRASESDIAHGRTKDWEIVKAELGF